MTEIVKAEHTTLPWMAIPTAFQEGFTVSAQPHAEFRGFTKVVAFVGDRTDVECEANARLIVTAVNVYPAVTDLVKALERTKVDLQAAKIVIESYKNTSAFGIIQTLKIVDSALARFRELQGGSK